MPPILSVITVCFNAQKTIKPTLDSLAPLLLRYPHEVEYLVIDGASTDHTTDTVRALTPSARIVSEPDKGIYDAMNKGLAKATGTYLWFLNAGDAVASEQVFEAIITRLRTYKPDVLYGDTMIVDSAYRPLHLRRLRPPAKLTENSFLNGMLVCHQAFIVRRAAAPLYDLRYRFSADYDWCIRILRHSRSNLFLNQVWVYYLNEGLTTRNHRRSLWERYRIMCRRYGFLSATARHLYFFFKRAR